MFRCAQVAVAVAVTMSACNSSDEGQPDAGDGDGGVDAGPGLVSLSIYDLDTGVPVENADVRFENPDGTVADTLTNRGGNADGVVAPGASVTAVVPAGANHPVVILSILGVQPGDHLLIGQPAPPPRLTASFTVNFTNDDAINAIKVATGCATAYLPAASTTANLVGQCALLPQPIVVTTEGADGLVAWTELPGQVIADGATFDVPDAWQEPSAFDVTVDNLPGEIDKVSADYRRADVDYGYSVSKSPPAAGPLVLTVGGPGLPPTAELDLSFSSPDHPQSQLQRNFLSATGDVSFDAADGAALLPWLGAPSFDAATRTVAWTETGGAVSPDVTVFQGQVVPVTGDTEEMWFVIAPPSTSLVLPSLPATASASDVASFADTAVIGANVSGGAHDATFDDLRPLLGQILFSNGAAARLPGDQLLLSQTATAP